MIIISELIFHLFRVVLLFLRVCSSVLLGNTAVISLKAHCSHIFITHRVFQINIARILITQRLSI